VLRRRSLLQRHRGVFLGLQAWQRNNAPTIKLSTEDSTVSDRCFTHLQEAGQRLIIHRMHNYRADMPTARPDEPQVFVFGGEQWALCAQSGNRAISSPREFYHAGNFGKLG
jgi:hypothetical protein